MVTMTMVGYGDVVPVATTGRATAAALMVAGLAFLGVVAASLAVFFGVGVLDESASEPPLTTPEVLDQLKSLKRRGGPIERAHGQRWRNRWGRIEHDEYGAMGRPTSARDGATTIASIAVIGRPVRPLRNLGDWDGVDRWPVEGPEHLVDHHR